MPVSHKHKAIFIHIPRTAGGSLSRALGMEGHDNRGSLTPPAPDMLFGLVGSEVLQHLTAREVRRRLGEETYKSYFKFAFVRNPYDRTVSIYHNRLRDLPKRHTDFRDFVLKRLPQGRRTGLATLFHSRAEKALEIQFVSQYDYLFDESGRPLTDFVGKMENLAADFKEVCRRVGLRAELPVTNKSEHEDYRVYYDAETKKAVGEIYRKDFEAFGYEL